jgi:hypothetical protein
VDAHAAAVDDHQADLLVDAHAAHQVLCAGPGIQSPVLIRLQRSVPVGILEEFAIHLDDGLYRSANGWAFPVFGKDGGNIAQFRTISHVASPFPVYLVAIVSKLTFDLIIKNHFIRRKEISMMPENNLHLILYILKGLV